MNEQNKIDSENLYFSELTKKIKVLLEEKQYSEIESLISKSMENYPHMAQPHNLFGVVYESQGEHILAMKHFRAALALNPSYEPPRVNIERFGSFFYRGKALAFDESDCVCKQKNM